MIQNDAELRVVARQLSRIKRALASLRREVLPKNRRNFSVLSEGYVDTIAELQAEIDNYRRAAGNNGESSTKKGQEKTKR